MAYNIDLECALFTVSFSTDSAPSPDPLDSTLTRLIRAFADGLAAVAPHASAILGEDEDDD